MEQSPETFFNLVLFGGITFILLSISLTIFIISYQRKVTEQELIRLDQERKLKENEFQFQRRLFEAVILAQEEEKQRIAEDLHDEIGPQLSLIKLSTGSIKTKVKSIQDLPFQIDKITAMLSEAITGIRRISHNLSSRSLEELGLEATLHSIAEEINSNGSVSFLLCIDNQLPKIEKQYATIIYRIVMELIQNSLKHGDPKEIKLKIKGYGNGLVLEYSDDGIGFDRSTIGLNGIGLKNLEHRVQILNGVKEITSSPGKGTFVKITIPITTF